MPRDYKKPEGVRDPTSHRTPAQVRKQVRGYNSRPEQIKQRSDNNKARRMLGLKVGDPRDAGHIKAQRHGGKATPGNLRPESRKHNRGWRRGE